MGKRFVAVIALGALVSSSAEAQNLRVCLDARGNMVARAKCARGEKPATLGAIRTPSASAQSPGLKGDTGIQGPSGVQGPAGPQGPTGPVGVFDVSNCSLQVESSNNFGHPLSIVKTFVECPERTFVVQHGGYSSSIDTDINQIALYVRPGQIAGYAVEYTAGFNKPGGIQFEFTVSALCCPGGGL